MVNLRHLALAAFLLLVPGVASAQQTQCPNVMIPKIISSNLYTITTADNCWWIALTNSGAVDVQLPAPGLIFSPGFTTTFIPESGTVTITLTQLADDSGQIHKVNGQTSLALTPGQGVALKVQQDLNWYAVPTGSTGGAVVGPSVTDIGSISTWSVTNGSALADGVLAYPGLAVGQDMAFVRVGGFPFADEVQAGGAFPAIQGVVGGVKVPPGSAGSCGGSPCADYGVAGYAVTGNAGRGAVGLYGAGGSTVGGALIEGANFAAVNCELHASACANGAGFNVAVQYTVEADANVYDTSGGAATGNVAGYIAILNAPGSQNTGSLTAYQESLAPGSQPWKNIFVCGNGDSAGCLNVGSTGFTANSPSQLINFISYDSGAAQVVNPLFQDGSSNLSFSNSVNGAVFVWASTSPEWILKRVHAGSPIVAQILNDSATAGTTAELSLATHTTNSYGNIYNVDGSYLEIESGVGNATGLKLHAGAGSIYADETFIASSDALLGPSTAIATTATTPFPYISTAAGAPTGVPGLASAGRSAIEIDSTNHKICWYEYANTAWKCAAGS